MALSANIEAAKNLFARRHHLPLDASSTVEAFFTHHVLLQRNLNEFLATQSWQREHKSLVGGTQDIQLDAIVVCIDGKPIRPDDDLREIDAAAAEGERPAISYVFVQATSEETGGKRLGQKISSFSDGVLSFFLNDGTDRTGINAAVMEWIGLKNRITTLLDDNDLENCCECAMYFVWPKVMQPDDNLQRVIALAEQKIALYPRGFARIEFHAFDRKRIEAVIAEAETDRQQPLRQGCDMELPLANFVPLPHPATVEASYLGYLNAGELIAMISSTPEGLSDTDFRHGIFASNIRSYQGSGYRVNGAMAETLNDPEQRREFGIRSNGIAILAQSSAISGWGRLSLSGAQIVNGCQTCHVLFEHRQLLVNGAGSDIAIPVKIIVTPNRDLANRAAMGLNRQTPVDETRLVTGPDVVDALAWRFGDAGTDQRNRALFERRQDEYAGVPAAEQTRVLSPYDIARAFASVFLPHPEHVNVQGKQPIIDKIRNERIFGRNQDIAPYFLCGVMVLRARESLLRTPNTKSWDRYPAKNLLLYAMRLIAEKMTAAGVQPDDLESDAGKAYVARLGDVLLDPDIARRIADEAVRCLILAPSDARQKLNAKNAGTARLAESVRLRAAQVALS